MDLITWDDFRRDYYEFSVQFDNSAKFRSELLKEFRSIEEKQKTINQINSVLYRKINLPAEIIRIIFEFVNPIIVGNITIRLKINELFKSCKDYLIPLFDTSLVTNMTHLFFNRAKFNQPLNSWNVSNVTTMCSMFSGCSTFNQPLHCWNISKVTDMYNMFYNCISFNQPINHWRDKVKYNRNMLAGCINYSYFRPTNYVDLLDMDHNNLKYRHVNTIHGNTIHGNTTINYSTQQINVFDRYDKFKGYGSFI